MKYIVLIVLVFLMGCQDDSSQVVIPDFNFPKTVIFEEKLSAYKIFDGALSKLTPSDSFHLVELSSTLFTDYSQKQRLVKVPVGTKIIKSGDGPLAYPDGMTLVKTFFYYHDERDTLLGKRIIESRLLVKKRGIWNVATYVWNTEQTEATLELNGHDTKVDWINTLGVNRSTNYHVPNENECISCHQSNSTMTPLGPTLRNVNRTVTRNNIEVNQLSHFQSLDIMNDFPIDHVAKIVDYTDVNIPLEQRGRAYLAMNCAHCHNPSGWGEAAGENFDFRYETPLSQTGILAEKNEIKRMVETQEMPFVGTTILDEEGIGLVLQFLNNL